MLSPFVILTGSSGVGKTTIARAVKDGYPAISVYLEEDTFPLVSREFMDSIGPTEGPGGPIQRSFALYWIGQIAAELPLGRPVLLDGQCRIAFLQEALALYKLPDTNIILVECEDHTRENRLHRRGSPELAHDEMRNWSLYLHREAVEAGCTILDTGALSLEQSVAQVVTFLMTKTVA